MRFVLIIFTLAVILGACAKPTSTEPVPYLEYVSAKDMKKTAAGNDTALVTFYYEDGDGNLFVDDYSQGPNLIMTTHYFNLDSNKYLVDKNFSNTIKQPDNGYYKGKAVKGNVILPLKEFRSNDTRRIIYFDIFMVDLKGNKSNVVSSPVYTLNF